MQNAAHRPHAAVGFVYAADMDTDNIIRLSGPFRVTDSFGRNWQLDGIRIFDEGYSIIDVYVDIAEPVEDDALHEDPLVIRQIVSRLRSVGYVGPDFGLGDPGLQDERVIVLEAPEAFSNFAATKGWKDLAEDYVDGAAPDILVDPASDAVYAALMRRLRPR
jgi:hypothetical protein